MRNFAYRLVSDGMLTLMSYRTVIIESTPSPKKVSINVIKNEVYCPISYMVSRYIFNT